MLRGGGFQQNATIFKNLSFFIEATGIKESRWSLRGSDIQTIGQKKKRNLLYLQRNCYSFYRSWGKDGETRVNFRSEEIPVGFLSFFKAGDKEYNTYVFQQKDAKPKAFHFHSASDACQATKDDEIEGNASIEGKKSGNISKKGKLKKLKRPEKKRLNVGKLKGVDWFDNNNFYSYKNFDKLSAIKEEEGEEKKKHRLFIEAKKSCGHESFTVLGIESSCDDTGVAIVQSDGSILGECIASQHAIHEEWGGVVPGLARDAHAAAINETISTALKAAGMTSVAQVDAIAVTQGPGLELCLRVGLEKAKELAATYKKPFVCAHHLEAHCLVARLNENSNNSDKLSFSPSTDSSSDGEDALLAYPFLALLVSGGHCLILEVRGLGDFVLLGGTLDDALGEAYDKAARLIGIAKGVAGGSTLEAYATKGNPNAIKLPIPLKGKKNLDLSYSGLKNALRMAIEREIDQVVQQQQKSIRWKSKQFLTSVLKKLKIFWQTKVKHIVTGGKKGKATLVKPQEKKNTRLVKSKKNSNSQSNCLPSHVKADLAASFQNTALKHLEDRLSRAMDVASKKGIHRLAVVGGVAANQELKKRLVNLCARKSEERRGQSIQNMDENEGKDQDDGKIEDEKVLTKAWELYVPPPKLCTDNGVMVAWAGIEKLKAGYIDSIENTEVRARWSLGQIYSPEEEENNEGKKSK